MKVIASLGNKLNISKYNNIDRPYTYTISNLNRTEGVDIVSFKGKRHDIYVSDMRDLPLNCACCDVDMLENSKVNDFMNQKIYYPAKYTLKAIIKENIFSLKRAPQTHKIAYVFLREVANQYPKLSIDELIKKKSVENELSKYPPEVIEACDDIKEMTKFIAKDSKFMIDELNKLKPDFRKLEKKIYKELQKLAKKYPDKTFCEILNKPEVNKIYKTKLEAKEIMVLNAIEDLIEDEPESIKNLVNPLIENAFDIFLNEKDEILHKRGRVISSFYSGLSEIQDTIIYYDILDIIEELPNSKTDLDAFMIKGSQKNSNLIIENLVNRIRNTREHVKPRHRPNDPGENTIYNYICMCGKCNGKRKMTGYDDFVEENPQMAVNTPKQIKKTIYYINAGILRGHDDYPEKIKSALEVESRGKIKVDISSLDIEEAKRNRDLRQRRYASEKKLNIQKRLREEMEKVDRAAKNNYPWRYYDDDDI